MKIHQHLTKQQRYAGDIQAVSALLLIAMLAIMIFSFCMQQLYTHERDAGRDIRSTAGNFTVLLFKTCRAVVLIHFAVDEKEPPDVSDLKELAADQMGLTQFHTYLQHTSILPAAFKLFVQKEQTYAIIQVLLHLDQYPQLRLTEADATLFIHYVSVYTGMLVQFQALYTALFVSNNNAASLSSTGEIVLEGILLSIFFFVVLRPAVKKFIDISKKSDEMQRRLIDTHTSVRKTQHDQRQSVTLPLDVVCVDHYIYKVARQGETVTVFYNEAADMFICECKMYVQDRFCFHTNRAKWLHDKIFRRTSASNVQF